MNTVNSTDIANTLALDSRRLQEEIKYVDSLIEMQRDTTEPCGARVLAPGVSVVIPTYLGVNRIGRALESLRAQSASADSFEIVIVANGPIDGTLDAIQAFAAENPNLSLRWMHRHEASAGSARNVGLALASKEYVTFLDDDDELEPGYIDSILPTLASNTITVSPITNISPEGEPDEENTLNLRIRELNSNESVEAHPWLLGFNACKTLPTEMARRWRYKSKLKSGEDLVYFANLLTVPGLKLVRAVSELPHAYVRHLTDNSVSRRQESFDFNVEQRLECIRALQQIEVASGPAQDARGALESAQAAFVARYLENVPSDIERVVGELARLGITTFPWRTVNQGKARGLAISYCFAPFSDTSAVVAAKAIAERGTVVDVILNDMSRVRRIDPAVSSLADRWIDKSLMIDAPPSFAGWAAISTFATRAFARAEEQAILKGEYETMYSRALWVGSHVAAALYKLRYPSVKWAAEFSDPLRYDAEGNARKGAIEDNVVSQRLTRALQVEGFEEYAGPSLFDLVEGSTFLLADELIFTNENQLEFMLKDYSNSMQDVVRSKARVRPHPQPPASAYEVVRTGYSLPTHVINIGYFGSFYSNRGIGEVLLALANLSLDELRRVRLHIFSNKKNDVAAEAARLGLVEVVQANDYLSYMEFLNAARQFDVLLVNDVVRPPSMEINPFLPSKYSDYKGAGRPIWALVDNGSPLSRMECEYASTAGDGADIFETLREIIRSRAKALGAPRPLN